MDEPTATQSLARLFIDARHQNETLEGVPEAVIPENDAVSYQVQDIVVNALVPKLGPVKGWKVGARTPSAEPFCAPIHRNTIFGPLEGPQEVPFDMPNGVSRLFGIEGEIVYRFSKGLPARAEPWTLEEVRAAIDTAHPSIEVADSRFTVFGSQDRKVHLADQQSHGALVIGPAYAKWAEMDPVTEPIKLIVDGTVVMDHKGGNSAGEPIRMLVWLANHAAARGRPIQAGDLVTTGSMTDSYFIEGGSTAEVIFENLGTISITVPRD